MSRPVTHPNNGLFGVNNRRVIVATEREEGFGSRFFKVLARLSSGKGTRLDVREA